MTIHEKINVKENPLLILSINQWLQILDFNRLALVPYYHQRLRKQNEYLKEPLQYFEHHGKWRYEVENNIN